MTPAYKSVQVMSTVHFARREGDEVSDALSVYIDGVVAGTITQ